MPSESQPGDPAPRPVVFLPCHSLDDFPTWLEEREADDLLAAWTAAWHPRLVAAAGMPRWASVDLPPPEGPLLGIVPSSWDDRFATQFDASTGDRIRMVRGTAGRAAIAAAALAAAGEPDGESVADRWIDDFQALGLAVLLAELLARRMRSDADLESTGLAAAVRAAAVAAVAGRDDDVRTGLAECFRSLEASRARYYPVDAWLVDLVLLTASTAGPLLCDELAAPVPLGVVAAPRTLGAVAARDADAVAALGERVSRGGATLCGGPLDERPLDARLPEEILESFEAGAEACESVIGRRPTVFARHGGGGSAFLPQVLSGLGFAGAVWGTFDGAALPDPGAGRILWEGTGGATIDALARPPLDARSAAATLTMPDRLGDAMDHDHVAVVTFAHPAGTASAWHGLLRRIGGWSTALGTFVAPEELFRRTVGAGMAMAFAPDAFPPSPLPRDAVAIDAAVAAAAGAARRIVARSGELAAVVTAALPAAAPRAVAGTSRGTARALAGWWTASRSRDREFVLESDAIRVAVHPETGGILALRRTTGGSNRLSQQLGVRGPDGHGRMVADVIERGSTASGVAGLVSRGRLLRADGRAAGTFVQGLALVPGRPLVTIDVEVRCDGRAGGLLADHHVACRFAWHENEDIDVRRGIHGQAVTTERTRFTAPHFVELVPAGARGVPGEAATILTGGLPWHVRSTPHVLDTILAGPAGAAMRRLAVGIGLERPWDAALEFLAGAPPGSMPRPGPANVRVTVRDVEVRDGRVARARIGILESAGSAGQVRLEWARDVTAAAAREYDGRPRPGTAVAIEGRAIVVSLAAYEWLAIDLEFGA
ncbi:MAG: hypothetical protein ACKOSQ_07650 [Planctomycetaceae bacterium]